jgi:hypothetical protein
MSDEQEAVRAGLSEAEMKSNCIRLVFQDDPHRYEEFCDVIARALPPETAAVIRGSAATGVRWEDGAPFDVDGPGTSDVDLTFVGGPVLDLFTEDGFYIPGVHSKPLGEEHPDIAPDLLPLREQLTSMVGRPVNIQATQDWTMFVREYLMGQPYFTIIGSVEQS